ncbi:MULTISPECIES: LysR family transcriptional regulator [unclassified Halomonas]|uniref:LysR family transcriptional regulator n=1 Tax=Halomonas sp. N3-2A TaxID=2014541 RepID=UPI000B5B12E8|nr:MULTISPECIES: LysR family transcriptional regulator [unclassified Halomonas]ASK21337.1 LysR family transcriptional regulator [Halomonas sp. N3-2A]UTD56702.1 LysR family transcriptional regulator [Halomonas sp. MS1]
MRPVHDTLDWNLLRTFIVIVQEESVSKAANRLYLSQPAVSLSLKRLEERLGQRLIERDSHSFNVTKAGHLVYREAIDIYANVARLAASVGDFDPEVVGHVSLLFITGIQCRFLDSVFERFHKKFPQITFSIEDMSSQEVQNALAQRQGAMGICLALQCPSNLNSQTLARQRYRLYCGKSHALFGRHNLPMDSLMSENYVSFGSEQLDGVLSSLAVFRAHHGLKGNVVGQSSSLQEIQRMVIAGWGIGCLPEHLVLRDVAEGRLWPLPPYDGVAEIDLHVMWHQDARFSDAETIFMEFFLNAMGKVPLEERLTTGLEVFDEIPDVETAK